MSDDICPEMLPLDEASAREYLTRGGWTKEDAILILNGLDPVANRHLLRDDSPPRDPMLATYWYGARHFAAGKRVIAVRDWIDWAVFGAANERRTQPLTFSRELQEAYETQTFEPLVRYLQAKLSRQDLSETELDDSDVLRSENKRQTYDMQERDFSFLATPQELLEAFGRWGLKKQWFNEPRNHRWLLQARKVIGKGSNKPRPPLYCPYEVMVGLRTKTRSKRTPFSEEKGWEILRKNFLSSYERFKGFIPDNDQSKNDS